MEDGVICRDLEACYICNEYMGTFKNEFTVVTGYSEEPIYKMWQSFSHTTLTPDIVENAGVCQNCFIKFHEYDEHVAAANKIKDFLVLLYEESNRNNSPEVIEVAEIAQVVNSELTEVVPIVKTESRARQIVTTEPFNIVKLEDGSYVQEIQVEDYIKQQSDIMRTTSQIPKKSKRNNNKFPKEDKDAGLIFSYVDGVKIYDCDICGKTGFSNRSRVRTHKATHTDERKFFCTICNSSFKTRNCLKNHERLHQNIFMYCDLCPAKFKHKNELRCHVDSKHLMKRDFKCHICGKAFSRDKSLKQHIAYHVNERNFNCEFCGFKAINRPKLRRHMKTHTGERNYTCPICHKKFLYSYNVLSHVRFVHNQEKRIGTNSSKLVCHVCGKKFQKIWKVKEHIAEMHPECELSDSIEYSVEAVEIKDDPDY